MVAVLARTHVKTCIVAMAASLASCVRQDPPVRSILLLSTSTTRAHPITSSGSATPGTTRRRTAASRKARAAVRSGRLRSAASARSSRLARARGARSVFRSSIIGRRVRAILSATGDVPRLASERRARRSDRWQAGLPSAVGRDGLNTWLGRRSRRTSVDRRGQDRRGDERGARRSRCLPEELLYRPNGRGTLFCFLFRLLCLIRVFLCSFRRPRFTTILIIISSSFPRLLTPGTSGKPFYCFRPHLTPSCARSRRLSNATRPTCPLTSCSEMRQARLWISGKRMRRSPTRSSWSNCPTKLVSQYCGKAKPWSSRKASGIASRMSPSGHHAPAGPPASDGGLGCDVEKLALDAGLCKASITTNTSTPVLCTKATCVSRPSSA